MALATQCPHCHTTFRVAHDQLKLRAGLVRCGACKQIFNGIENLLKPEALEQVPGTARAPQPAMQESPAKPETPTPADSVTLPHIDFHIDIPDDLHDAPPPAAAPAVTTAAPVPEDAAPLADNKPAPEPVRQKDDPLLRMTLMDFADGRREPVDGNRAPGAAVEETDDSIGQAIDDLESKPWRREQDASELADGDALDRAEAAEYEEPSFVKKGRRRQRVGRVLRIMMAAGSVVLLFALLAQAAYVFRDQIAAWYPDTKPALAAACARLGCQVGLPAQIDAVSIESSELQTVAADSSTFALAVLLRNHGATEQAWPAIELTLNDSAEKPLARRVFLPREYLPAPDAKPGFPAGSEQPVKLFFELAQLKASGYRVYLFYP
ncbi:MAG TPA: DUF3426 domain-containing protein [Noviherbaspirillum sp.]|uniref:DUF3426 domain-containing protein n=1 Tax=Noviherbaspirillum sp. TaxID=1926288 RepID=UPI002D354BD7|nr:DUF3426 domain-containing protein [Noviherbaspirillum sp.]HYD95634.1 DUF3426 domain-containing protein [Noviherbaspirillum sp.]